MTATKQRRLVVLRREILPCTQFYINSLWNKPGRLDKETMDRFSGGSLSYRHRSNCLKTALETIISTRKAAKLLGKMVSRPKLSNKGAITLSSLVAKIEKGKGSFDYVLKISGLSKGNPIVIPFKSHKRLNYWLNQSGAKLLQGCILGDNWAALWIKIPDPVVKNPNEGRIIAVDTGINKLFVDSDGNKYGLKTKEVCARVRRCKPGSKGRLRASRARKDYINKTAKELPWKEISVLGTENLKNMKKGKKKGRGKSFRKAVAPWTYRQAITRLEALAQENRVRFVAVNPKNTSRTCPDCGAVSIENRKGEKFSCIRCNYSADADFVGARNILVKTFGNSQQSMVAECFDENKS